MNDRLFLLQSQKKSTNHILHLIISIVTGGIWLMGWLGIAISNYTHNKKIQADMDRFFSYKAQGLSDVEAYQQEVKEKAEHKKLQIHGCIVLAVIVFVLYVIFR